MTISIGDHIAVSRGLYSHHGVYAGSGMVIHFSGELGRKQNARVCETTLAEFAQGGRVYRVESACSVTRTEVVRRARSRCGERSYSILFNNCEHFARRCREGRGRSKQVETFAGLLFGALGIGLAGLTAKRL